MPFERGKWTPHNQVFRTGHLGAFGSVGARYDGTANLGRRRLYLSSTALQRSLDSLCVVWVRLWLDLRGPSSGCLAVQHLALPICSSSRRVEFASYSLEQWKGMTIQINVYLSTCK